MLRATTRAMAKCPHVESCALFPLFNLGASLKVWQENYCHGTFAKCARFQRSAEGKMSPMNLLPNGKMLALAAKKADE